MAESIKLYQPPRVESSFENKKPEGTRAIFRNWFPEKGFGFLSAESGDKVFCHINELCTHLRPDFGKTPDKNATVYIGNIRQTEKGLTAKEVCCKDCAMPPHVVVEPTGKQAGEGVPEYTLIQKGGRDTSVHVYNDSLLAHINRPYIEALQKKQRFEGNDIWSRPQSFFREFGRPNISLTADGKYAFVFSYGTLIRDSIGQELLLALGKIQPEKVAVKDGMWLRATFLLSEHGDIPATVECGSVFGSRPKINEEVFKQLSSELQKELFKLIYESLPDPEQIAEENIEKILQIGEVHNDKPIRRLLNARKNLYALAMPGDIYKISDKNTQKEWVDSSESPDGYRPASSDYMNVTRTITNLFVGIRKHEHDSFSHAPYSGGVKVDVPFNKFGITENFNTVPDEVVLTAANKYYADEFQKAHEDLLQEALHMMPLSNPEILLHGDKQYIEMYAKKYMDRSNLLLDEYIRKIAEEDQKGINSAIAVYAEWKKYGDEYREARERARAVRVTLGSYPRGEIGVVVSDNSFDFDIGKSSSEELKIYIQKCQAFLDAVREVQEKIVRERIVVPPIQAQRSPKRISSNAVDAPIDEVTSVSTLTPVAVAAQPWQEPAAPKPYIVGQSDLSTDYSDAHEDKQPTRKIQEFLSASEAGILQEQMMKLTQRQDIVARLLKQLDRAVGCGALIKKVQTLLNEMDNVSRALSEEKGTAQVTNRISDFDRRLQNISNEAVTRSGRTQSLITDAEAALIKAMTLAADLDVQIPAKGSRAYETMIDALLNKTAVTGRSLNENEIGDILIELS